MPSDKTRQHAKAFQAMHAQAERQGVAVKVGLVDGIDSFKRRMSSGKVGAALQTAIKSGDYRKVMKAIPFGELGRDLKPMHDALLEAAREGSSETVRMLPKPTQKKLRYDASNPRVEGYIRGRTGEQITTSEQGMLAAVRQSVRRSFTHALTPDQVAGEIRGSIGLNARQVTALNSYRDALSQTDHSAAAQQAMADAYESRLLDQRAIMIARTEVRFAQNAAQNDVWLAAADDDLLPSSSRRVWVVDGNPCPQICEPMDGEETGLDEPWTLPDGRQVDNPTDAHPNCYCIASLVIG